MLNIDCWFVISGQDILEKLNEISQMMSEVPIPLIWSQLGGQTGGAEGRDLEMTRSH